MGHKVLYSAATGVISCVCLAARIRETNVIGQTARTTNSRLVVRAADQCVRQILGDKDEDLSSDNHVMRERPYRQESRFWRTQM